MNYQTPLNEILKAIPAVFGIHLDETPKYDVLERGELELRLYPKLSLLSCREYGRHEWAINKAFTRLAKFTLSHDMPLTVPVFQDKHEDGVTLSFFVPDKVIFKDRPETIEERFIPARIVAVYSYSGLNVPTAMDEAKERLEELLTLRDDLEVKGDAFFAQYDSPATIPFLRTNEVMVEVCHTSSK